MFQPEPSITRVPAPREQVVAVVESINQPQVSIPGKAAAARVRPPPRACGTPNGTFSIYVALHLPRRPARTWSTSTTGGS